MLCRRGEKSLVLLMYNAGLSQSLQRRGKKPLTPLKCKVKGSLASLPGSLC